MAKVYSLNKNQEREENKLTIDLSTKTMLFVVMLLAVIFYAKQLILVLMFLFTGFVFMSSIKPVVNWFVRRKISKGWAIALAYLLLSLIITTVLSVIFVPFVNQLTGLVEIIPVWFEDLLVFLEDFSIMGYVVDVEMVRNYVADFIKDLPTIDNVRNIAGFISGFLGGGAFLVTSVIFSVYLVSEHDSFFDLLLVKISSDEKRKRVKKLVLDVERKLGEWVLGQAVVSTLIAIFSGILITVLGIPFALPLSILTGFLGIIPNLGPTLAGVFMTLVALITVGPVGAIILLVSYVVYQSLENAFIVPKVMGNAVGLKPVVVMLGVVVALMLFGVVGGIIAVPTMVITQIIYEFYIDLQKLKAKGIV